MPDLSRRSYQPEIMDDLSIDDDGLQQSLQELDFINQWLGGNAITLTALKSLLGREQMLSAPLRIADLGCGRGEMLRLIQKRLLKDNPKAAYIGIDANPAVVRAAKADAGNTVNMEYQCLDVFDAAFAHQHFDVAICTLFLHHFTEEELVGLLTSLRKQCRLGLVINDLHRHTVAYHAIDWLTRLFSKSYMTRNDAKLSVARGFSRSELSAVLQKAGWESFTLTWAWAFRWKVVAFS